MKARLLAACTAAVTLLSGCTFSTSIDGLLSPPKLSVEQEQIYEALRRAAGSNISLKYPCPPLSSAILTETERMRLWYFTKKPYCKARRTPCGSMCWIRSTAVGDRCMIWRQGAPRWKRS